MKHQFFVGTKELQLQKKLVTMNVKVYRRDYVNKHGLSPIYLLITSQGKRIRQRLPIEVRPEDWDEKKGRFKKSAENAVGYNIAIENEIAKIKDVRLVYYISNKELTLEQLVQEYNNASSNYCFVAFMEKYVEQQNIKPGSLRKEKSRIAKIKRFQKEIPFSQITIEWIERYIAYMAIECKNNPNTIDSNIRTVKKYLHMAERYGIHLNINLSLIQTRTYRSNRINLNFTELDKLKDFYFSSYINPRLKLPLGYFLFSCYTGLRINEIKKLKRQGIGKTITFTSDKTGKTNTIPVNNSARSFVEHYPDLFVKWISDQKMNDYIREAVNFVGIRKRVSFHTARHTFATNFLRKGGKVEDLQKLLDHSDISTTMIYVHIIETEQINTYILDD
ncbi:site-specific integrase [Capnocytophaga canimorsus]|nr:site-specific integrase [Capnocytophaga canimorsus]MDT9499105.1 tyrosine-type recombinase/integrase [Capnocytophaga canimorsus]